MLCSICKEECYPRTNLHPAEPCLCGEMASTSPWKWMGWKGVRKRLRYWLAAKAFWIGNYLIMYKTK